MMLVEPGCGLAALAGLICTAAHEQLDDVVPDGAVRVHHPCNTPSMSQIDRQWPLCNAKLQKKSLVPCQLFYLLDSKFSVSFLFMRILLE